MQTGGLEEKHFSGFCDSQAIFPRRHHTKDQQIDTMKNPLFWALLVGMTILLMEQGKDRGSVGHPWGTCYRFLRLCLDETVGQLVISFPKCLVHVLARVCDLTSNLSI